MTHTTPKAPDRSLRPRARLMLTIGLELISSETVALTELVKNSYDADASTVLVRLSGPVRDGAIPAGQGTIEILDDGVGMSGDVIANTWLEPATPNRRRQKHSRRGRRLLGEKGVGRFAAAKLAQRLSLSSRSNGNEVTVSLDWRAFEDEDAYLDEIDIDWSESQPDVFSANGLAKELWSDAIRDHVAAKPGAPIAEPNARRGTLLRLEESRVDWTRSLVAELRTTLARLISPFDADQDLVRDFGIILDGPSEFGALVGLVEPPEQLSRPHYTLDADVSADGLANGKLSLKDGTGRSFEEQLVDSHGDPVDEDHPLRCGPFTIRLRVWDRDMESLRELAGGDKAGSVRDILDQAAGISVYRDGFRVLPYGEPRDDWLRLDLRRVNSPTRRLSNNQIVGYLAIGRDTNPDLIDQTNREGIVEGPALEDLRQAILQLLNILEQARYKIRPRRDTRKKGGLLDRIDLGELRSAIAAALPTDTAIVAMVTDLQRELDERTAEVGQALARYHRLATLGQLVDRVVHELGQPLVKARTAADLGLAEIERAKRLDAECRELVGKLADRFTRVSEQTRVANDVVRRIQPFGGRRRGRPPQIRMEDAVANSVALLDDEIRKVGTGVSLPTGATTVTVDGVELQEVVVNLLNNSLYWLRRVPKDKRQIAIRVTRNRDESVSLFVEDSGPGVPEEDQPHIFDPYYTTREGGAGLGLAIAGEIVSDFYGGELELLPPGELGGALFRATLRRRVS